MPNPIESLRAALSQASLLPLSAQSGLVEELNLGMSPAKTPYLDTANAVIDHFWKGQAPSEESMPVIRWTRWTGLQGDSGLAALLQTPKSRLIVLPTQTEPSCLNLQESTSELWLRLLADLHTAHKYESTKLVYARVPTLTTATYMDQCGEDYREYLRHRYTPASRDLPSACLKPDKSFFLEDHLDTPYRAVAAAQLGFQHLLCRVVPQFAAPNETLTVGALASAFPKIQTFRPALQAPEKIPATRFFGGCHPERGPVTFEIAGSIKLYNGRDIPIGEAQILAGGAEGLIEFHELDFNAYTSEGEALSEADETRNEEDGCLIGHFKLQSFPRVFFKAGFDGLGGAPWGEIAQSAALQGIHACLVAALAEGRIPYPHELLEAAARAVDAQVQLLEKNRGKKYAPYESPDAVGSVTVIIGDLVLIASTGDFAVTISEQRPDGSLETIAYTNTDVSPEQYVQSTVRSRNAKFYAHRLRPNTKTQIMSFSDGVLQNLLGDFKVRMSQEIRAAQTWPLPDRSFFHNLDTLSTNTPPNRVSRVLHDIALKGINADKYPKLFPVERYHDNLTVIAKSINNPEPSGLDIPQGYREMERVTKARQYHYESMPTVLHMPAMMGESFLGREEHPEGKTMLVIPNDDLAPVHARFFRENDAYFVELMTPDRGLEIRRGGITQGLTKAGDKFELLSLDTLVLASSMSVEIRLPDSESNIQTIRPT